MTREGKNFTFSADLQENRHPFRNGAKKTGRVAFKGARKSVSGPGWLTLTGVVLLAASWVAHPSHDWTEGDFERVEHLGNAVEELGEIEPRDESLQNIITEIQERKDDISATGNHKLNEKRAQAANYLTIVSGTVIGAGAGWYGISRRNGAAKNSYNELEEDIVPPGAKPPKRADTF